MNFSLHTHQLGIAAVSGGLLVPVSLLRAEDGAAERGQRLGLHLACAGPSKVPVLGC
jgi:hypothetical protein